jgi:hypothetical protein
MRKGETPATIETVAAMYGVLCTLQEAFNEIAISHWALLNAAVEKDPPFGNLYLAHKEVTENGPTGKSLTIRLQKMKEVLAKLEASLR